MSTTAGTNALGATVNDFPFAETVTGPETAMSANSLRTAGQLVGGDLRRDGGGRDLDGAVSRPPAAHGVGGARDVGGRAR